MFLILQYKPGGVVAPFVVSSQDTTYISTEYGFDDVQRTNDNGYVGACTLNTATPYRLPAIIKFDNAGNPNWGKVYDGTGVVGNRRPRTDVDSSSGDILFCVEGLLPTSPSVFGRLSQSGTEKFVYRINDGGFNTTRTVNIGAVGNSTAVLMGNRFLHIYDITGTRTTFHELTGMSAGTAATQRTDLTTDGTDIYVAGSSVTGNTIRLQKFSASGTPLSENLITYSGSFGNIDDVTVKTAPTGGNIVVVFSNGTGDLSTYVATFNSNLDHVSTFRVFQTGAGAIGAKSGMFFDSNGDYVVLINDDVGPTTGAILLKASPTGTIDYQVRFSGAAPPGFFGIERITDSNISLGFRALDTTTSLAIATFQVVDIRTAPSHNYTILSNTISTSSTTDLSTATPVVSSEVKGTPAVAVPTGVANSTPISTTGTVLTGITATKVSSI